MALSNELEILNRVLRELSGCLLQYVGECWPWSAGIPGSSQQRDTVQACVARQGAAIRRLAEYLTNQQSRVEYGQYAADFTDLHYVSLKFLMQKLIAAQSRLVEAIDRAKSQLAAGDAAADLLQSISNSERENLNALRQAGT